MKEPESSYMRSAREELASVKGKHLTIEQREKKAIDLAAQMLREATRIQTQKEKTMQRELARMMVDPRGKAFTMTMTDECFRSHRPPRIASQMIYLLHQFGIPRYLSFFKRLQLALFKEIGSYFSYALVPISTMVLRRATSTVILPGEHRALARHMQLRRQQGVRLNINHLGEAILGEKEAKHRLSVYLHDFSDKDIDYISVKISTIYSQINLLGWEETLEILATRLRELYRAAIAHPFTHIDGTKSAKFVNLDMEEYRDLQLTKDLFKKVLDEPEFLNYSAGIVLQAYLPDSHEIQKEITEWAKKRRQRGGANVKIRIVKGANLAMEQFEASLRDWPQAPYKTKIEVDANYKRMVTYGCHPENADAVHLGIGSHNLFDIAYAMLLREEEHVQGQISFEMLEGMADHIRRVVQRLTGGILLYCPTATKEDFQSAVGYLVRRLDENTGPENFLRHTFGLKPDTPEWRHQADLFVKACEEMKTASTTPRREQNRFLPPEPLAVHAVFRNEADTDFSLKANRDWALEIVKAWKDKVISPIPLVIGGKEIYHPTAKEEGEGYDPSFPSKPLYHYSLATWEEIDDALKHAKAFEPTWAHTSVEKRCQLLAQAAQKLREKRGDLIGVMMADGGKIILEADVEVSEAIDFADYYLRTMHTMNACSDITWKPKGTILVAPPWNFPVSIPAGGIFAALVAGNCVLFKPAPESVLSGWILIQTLWEAGIPKEALQFINCADDPEGSRLIADPRLNCVILTGATSTAKLFLKLRPNLDLAAETGGKNAMIITGMADRDLAIKDLLQSAFGHSGQKCSATSLAILEAEVYDDPHFRELFKDAVKSLKVGSPWNLSSKVIPLIRSPNETLYRGFTVLDPGETWLVKPEQDAHNPNLWSPGVKLGVKEGSFMHQTELFGPVLGVMRAKNLEHALQLANGTPYGLTSGIHSLDARERKIWMEHIEAGNCYVNRGTTGAIVRRQPFGGTKASSFGPGAKAGGPNYVHQFAHPTQASLPSDKAPLSDAVNQLSHFLSKLNLSAEELGIWYVSISNYAFWAKRFAIDHDPSKIVGQDNFLRYRPHKHMALKIQKNDPSLDILRAIAAALSVDVFLTISWCQETSPLFIHDQWKHLSSRLTFHEEPEEQFLQKVQAGNFKRIRLLSAPSESLLQVASQSATYLNSTPVLASGHFELLHYLREISFSIDYHRYGNLGVREGEIRAPIP
jgi:RHH-type transcriptional regulator, proline utilization regulon repressor / proline dehydrogenase / delta 1-pyrroline-5-carboxylate dehydrogenase